MVGRYVDFGVRTDSGDLDVTDIVAVRDRLGAVRPKTIIHLAAATDLARCELDPDFAYRVNVRGTYNVALVAREIGAKVVYVSTSAVFDGTKEDPYKESDVPNPKNVYAHTKYVGELIVRGLLERYLIARIAWVFGGGPESDHKFVSKILEQRNQRSINVVSGKRGSPTYGKDAVNGIKTLLDRNESGIFHLSNAGSCSRAEFAQEILRIANSSAKVQEVPMESPYYIGKNESMISAPFMRPWNAALEEYLRDEWHI